MSESELPTTEPEVEDMSEDLSSAEETALDAESVEEEDSANPSSKDSSPARRKGVEILEVTSGAVVAIDQFMLGNKHFLVKMGRLRKEMSDPQSNIDKIAEVVQMYGGTAQLVEKGFYEIYRDPKKSLLVLTNKYLEDKWEDEETEDIEEDIRETISAKPEYDVSGRVFVDTRCLVFVDLSLFASPVTLDEYRRIRADGQEKKARDLLRNNGAAVRYGFNRYGDELGVFVVDKGQTLAFWPELDETVATEAGEEEADDSSEAVEANA